MSMRRIRSIRDPDEARVRPHFWQGGVLREALSAVELHAFVDDFGAFDGDEDFGLGDGVAAGFVAADVWIEVVNKANF